MPALLNVALVVFLEVICLGAIWPTLSRYVTEDLGGSEAMAGWMFAAVAAPKVICNPLWGWVSDRIGRKPVLIGLCVLSAVGSALWALAPVIGPYIGGGMVCLAISRLVYGSFSAQATLAFAVASDVSQPEKRAGALGLLGAAFGFGLVVGFPAGGIVAQHLGLPAVGWLCMACELLAALLIAIALRETRQQHAPHSGQLPRVHFLRLIIQPAMIGLIVICLVHTIGLSVITPTLSPYVRDLFDFDVAQAGYAFLVFGIVSVIVQGGLIRPTVKAIGERATFILGTIILASGYAMLAMQLPVTWLWVSMSLVGIGAGFSSPALASMFSLSVSPQDQGSAHGLNQSMLALGRAISYSFAGAAYSASIGMPYWIGAAIVLASIVPLLFFIRRPEKASPAAP